MVRQNASIKFNINLFGLNCVVFQKKINIMFFVGQNCYKFKKTDQNLNRTEFVLKT